MKRITISLFLLIIIACRNDVKEVKTYYNKETKDNLFKVSMTVVVNEDDKLQLFYVDNFPEAGFNEKKRVAINIKGSKNPQEIKFILPKKVFPYKFRIDLGENKKETPIDISEIKIQFNNSKIVMDKLILERFFQPNIYLQKMDRGYLRKVIEGKYDPFLVSTPLLNKKVELEL